MHVRIEKIGGENSAALRETVRLIEQNQKNHIACIYVFSAFRTSTYNTTTELLRVIEHCRMGDQAQAKNTLDTIRDFYRDTIAENGYLDDRREVLLENLFDSYQERLDTYVQ